MQKKLKILLVSETFPPDVNGAAVFVSRLAVMLSQNADEVAVIAPSVDSSDHCESVSENLRVYRMKSVSLKPIHPYFRVVWKAGLTKRIKKIFEEFQPDIVHIHNHFLLGRTSLKIAKEMQVPVMGTNHFMPDNLTEYFPKVFEKQVSKYMWKDFVKNYNQLDYVTAPTHVALKMAKDLGVSVPSKVISNGIDLSEFKLAEVIDDATYEKFSIKKGVPIFLFVGRLERDKNVDLILRALALNKGEIPFQMIVVGKGKDELSFKKLAKTLGLGDSVIFTGKVSDTDLKQLYSIADVYIGSGGAELQGIAVMEAMAHGLPVLAANAVALPELVENDVNGYLFELEPENLAEKMREILKDEKKLATMAQKSLILIKKHSKEDTLKAFLKLYQKLL